MSSLKKRLDRLSVAVILLMISFPFTRAVLPVVGETNVKSKLLAISLVTFFIQWLFSRYQRLELPMVTLAAFVVYGAVSILLNRPFPIVAKQIFEYAPFIIAIFILASDSDISFQKLIDGIALATVISGVSAAFIFYFQTAWMPVGALSENAFSWGRLPWRNAYNILPMLCIVLFSSERLGFYWRLLLLTTIALIPAVLTFSRTFLLSVTVAFGLSLIYAAISGRMRRQVYFVVLASIGVFALLDIFSFENVLRNIEYRIVGLVTLTSDISGHISVRTQLYQQYLEVFSASPFIGVGFGYPFSISPIVSFYSDVTLVSFGLPFGLIGIVLIFAFWGVLIVKILNQTSRAFHDIRAGLIAATIICIGVSLNDDIWSHKEFVIVIALLVRSIESISTSAEVPFTKSGRRSLGPVGCDEGRA